MDWGLLDEEDFFFFAMAIITFAPQDTRDTLHVDLLFVVDGGVLREGGGRPEAPSRRVLRFFYFMRARRGEDRVTTCRRMTRTHADADCCAVSTRRD